MNGQQREWRLENVLLALELRRNLFTISVVNDKQYSIRSSQQKFKITNRKGLFALIDLRYDGLFKI
jgi:hypothetical protein